MFQVGGDKEALEEDKEELVQVPLPFFPKKIKRILNEMDRINFKQTNLPIYRCTKLGVMSRSKKS